METGGGDHPDIVPDWNAPILERKAEIQRKALQTAEGLKAVMGDTEI